MFMSPKKEATMVSQLRRLNKLSKEDPEAAHVQADTLLIDFVHSLGYHKIYHAYERITKYYS